MACRTQPETAPELAMFDCIRHGSWQPESLDSPLAEGAQAEGTRNLKGARPGDQNKHTSTTRHIERRCRSSPSW